MTVKELAEKLRMVDGDLEVWFAEGTKMAPLRSPIEEASEQDLDAYEWDFRGRVFLLSPGKGE